MDHKVDLVFYYQVNLIWRLTCLDEFKVKLGSYMMGNYKINYEIYSIFVAMKIFTPYQYILNKILQFFSYHLSNRYKFNGLIYQQCY